MRDATRAEAWSGAVLAAPLALFLTAMLAYPLVRLAILATTPRLTGLDHTGWLALRNSLLLSALVAFGSLLLCIVPAWVLARWNVPGRTVIRSALTLPMTFSGVIIGFLAIVMFGRVGAVPQVAQRLLGAPLGSGLAYEFGGLVLAYLYFEIPRATLALESSFRELDADLEAAAATLGARPITRMTRLVIPLTAPAFVSVWLLTFAVSLGSYGVALMLSRRFTILPLEVYTSFTAFLDDQRAALMSLVLISIAAMVGAATLLLRRHT